MIKLAGASKGAVSSAKFWSCPVRVAKAIPGKLRPSSKSERPLFVCNQAVQIDLQYLKDVARNTYVCLRMVDRATSYHIGVMLKSRNAAYVGRIFVKRWIGHFGIPDELTHDQGGEVSGRFILILEKWGMRTRVTGTQVDWQLARYDGMATAASDRYGSLVVDSLVVVWSSR